MSKKTWSWMLLSSASLAAMGALATPAMAQEASEEIVVTATGRAAAIQDVPIAVQAITGEALKQDEVHSLLDLNQLTPTMRIGVGQSSTAGTIASIRGIGTGADNPGFESAVGFFIDGVYRARAGTALGDLPEVERIEVLRGPQGTLFGKNTSAGAISVVTAGPEFDFHTWAEAGVGDRNELRTAFGMTGPLSENFALRFDGSIRSQDGYIDGVDPASGRHFDINNTNRWSARGQALWDINENATLRVIVDGSHIDENCCGAVNVQSGSVVGPLLGIYFPGSLLAPNVDARQMTVTPSHLYREQADDFGVSAQLDWDLGGVNLTSITAYRNWDSTRDQDIDFASFDRAYRSGLEIGFETTSEEIRLQGEHGRLNWLVGLFGSRENMDTTDRIRFGTDALTYANAATYFLTMFSGPLDSSGNPTPVPGNARKLYNAPVVVPGAGGLTDVQICALSSGTSPFCTSTTHTQSAALLGVPSLADVYLPNITNGNGQQADRWGVQTDTLSIFTHNEISLTQQLVLTLGARFNHETKDLDALLNSTNAGCAVLQNTLIDPDGPGPAGPTNLAALVTTATSGAAAVPFALACNAVTNTLANGAWTDKRTENEWGGTASLAYHINDDVMVYGSYSRGYKAGGFNVDRSAFFGPGNLPAFYNGPLSVKSLEFNPEFTDAYEFGVKSNPMPGMTLNATLFYEQISDYQENAFSGFNFFTLNVPELITKGVELEFAARPTDRLTVTAGVLYDDAYYNSSATFGGETIAKGTPLADAPDWTVTGSANYRQPLPNHWVANFYINGRWVSDYRTQTLGRNPITDNGAFALFDARIGIGPENERWGLDVFVRNLTDETYYVGGFGAPERTLPGALDPTGSKGNYLVYPNEPRTVGVVLHARY
ncbi:MAG TPA: TonB-dependent receptor [Caulobacterales bacterium]|nr:TonB-dependent receptor [Caulobacterales bacterium]